MDSLLNRNKKSWIESLALPTGQYFSFKEAYSDKEKGFFTFSHLAEDSMNIVVIEPNEITFKYYDENEYDNRDYLKISINNNSAAAAIIETDLIDLSTESGFQKLFSDFLIDLYANNGFQECGKEQEVKLALETIPLIQGVIHNSLFKFYSSLFEEEEEEFKKDIRKLEFVRNKKHPNFFKTVISYFYEIWNLKLDSLSFLEDEKKVNEKFIEKKYQKKKAILNNDDSKGRELENVILKKLKLSFHNWTNFMLNPKNERYFSDANKWFKNSLDFELIKAKIQLHYGLKVTKESNIDVIDTRRIANHFIKRYGIFEALSLSWQTKEEDRRNKKEKKTSKLVYFFRENDNLEYFLSKVSGNDVTRISLVLIFLTVGTIITNLFAFDFIEYDEVGNIFKIIIPLLFTLCFLWLWFVSLIASKAKIFPSIILPRVLVAIISGWIFFITAEELLKIDYDFSGLTVLIVGLIIIVFLVVFMLNEIRNYAPSMKKRTVIGRAIILILISFCTSYFFGFFVMSGVNEKFMKVGNIFSSEAAIMQVHYEDLKKYEDELIAYRSLAHLYEVTDKKRKYLMFYGHENGYINPQMKLNVIGYLDDHLSEYKPNIEPVALIDNDVKVKLDYLENMYQNLEKTDKAIHWYNEFEKYHNTYENFEKYFKGAIYDFDSIYTEKKSRTRNLGTEFLSETKKPEGAKVGDKVVLSQTFSFLFFEVAIFPNMIFLRSIIAMFIGIFLQLIIQDKSITEPI